jgi:microcystin-dependent protein
MLKILLGASLAGAALMGAPGALAQSQPFVGQITPTAATYCPEYWSQANGQLIAISSNTALFSLYGTTYGGDGVNTFALPDLRGRMVGGRGQGPGLTMRQMGSRYGTDSVTLTINNLATHTHEFLGSTSIADQPGVNGGTLGMVTVGRPFAEATNLTQIMRAGSIGSAGDNLPVNVQQPYLTVLWCVSLYGIYPSRS